mgnify:FL=1
MIALPAVCAGNSIVNVPEVTVLSAPKLIAHTDLFEFVELYIKQPLAVNDAVDPQLVLANKQHAVSVESTGVVLVKVFPPLV